MPDLAGAAAARASSVDGRAGGARVTFGAGVCGGGRCGTARTTLPPLPTLMLRLSLMPSPCLNLVGFSFFAAAISCASFILDNEPNADLGCAGRGAGAGSAVVAATPMAASVWR